MYGVLVHQQPRTKATPKGKSKDRNAPHDDERAKKAAKRLESRKRAEKFAESLSKGKGVGEGEDTSDESDNGSEDTNMSDAEEPKPMPTPAKPSPSPAASRYRPAPSPSPAVQPSRPTPGMIPDVPPMPAPSSPTSIRRRRPVGGSTDQPLLNGNGNGNGTYGNGGPATPSVGLAGRRSSFLQHADINNTITPAASTGDADRVPAVLNDSRRQSETVTGPAGPGSGRSSFLSRVRVTPSEPDAPADDAGKAGVNVAGQQEDGEAVAAHRHGVDARAQGRARIWALKW